MLGLGRGGEIRQSLLADRLGFASYEIYYDID